MSRWTRPASVLLTIALAISPVAAMGALGARGDSREFIGPDLPLPVTVVDPCDEVESMDEDAESWADLWARVEALFQALEIELLEIEGFDLFGSTEAVGRALFGSGIFPDHDGDSRQIEPQGPGRCGASELGP